MIRGRVGDVIECFPRDRDYVLLANFESVRGYEAEREALRRPPFAEMIKKLGLRDDGGVLTYFDLIEMDEGRWYPDMWRDA